MATVFETPRLIARHWTFDDADALLALFEHPDMSRFIPGPPMTTLDDARAALRRIHDRYEQSEGRLGGFALVEKASGSLVGNSLLKHMPDAALNPTADIEIGWHTSRASWGCGYASEAARACLAYGFEELGLPVIHAVIFPANERSIRVAQRIGLVHRGLTDRYYGERMELFSLEREQFNAVSARTA